MIPTAPLVMLIVAVTTATLVFGSIISYLAHRAASRRDSRSLRLFSYGFGTITLGLFLGAIAALVFGLDAEGTLLVQGLLVAPGFVLLLGSLYDAPRTLSA
ncbi:DUF7521 family protein [Halosimplex salinum]|uniref:DUF7521 family protein n=1 Tax=Halosimplex salinum TaxID=1710538 RepID=UPI0013DDFE09|nr:oxidoreductase [Halosimplex salinum]